MDQLTQLSYMSTSRGLLTNTQLELLLDYSRKTNKEYGITGMLLYNEGSFMQVIEGLESNIDQLFLNIKEDPMHRGIIHLSKDSIQQRDFSDWSMGFQRVSATKLEGFSNLLSTTPDDVLAPGLARTLLLSFKS